ncbi:hypothetical protein [Paenibacillus sp. Soil787]|uniref:hypothetical protein n=1 Tax=Paenibacillus sp. Soil787 TaxID=1736411 RepID=UPI0006FE4A6F|nr:hypothetical protein [Paenibacillus sp. Soil787]
MQEFLPNRWTRLRKDCTYAGFFISFINSPNDESRLGDKIKTASSSVSERGSRSSRLDWVRLCSLARPLRPIDVVTHLGINHRTAGRMLQLFCTKGWFSRATGAAGKTDSAFAIFQQREKSGAIEQNKIKTANNLTKKAG